MQNLPIVLPTPFVVPAGAEITSIAVGVVFAKTHSSGTVMLSCMPFTRPDGHKSIRQIMETGEGKDSVMKTYRRSFHEAAKFPNSFKSELLSPDPIQVDFGWCRVQLGGIHMRVFFLASTNSPLRDFEIHDGEDLLGPVTRIEAKNLLAEMKGKTVLGHYMATLSAVGYLAAERPVFDKYEKDLRSLNHREFTPAELEMVSRYPGKW